MLLLGTTQSSGPGDASSKERSFRILVVDDTEAQRYAVRRVLERAGHAVDEAATGGQALAMAVETGYDAIILDIELPDADGFEVGRRLRALLPQPVPIVHLSAERMAHKDRIEALTSGGHAFLTHPFDRDELLATIAALIHVAGADRREQSQLATNSLLSDALDALGDHIALLDARGVIVAVNRAWQNFADANDYPGQGTGLGLDYAAVCEVVRGDEEPEGLKVAHGIRDVLSGRRAEFVSEYPCHSPSEQRWYEMSVRRVSQPGTGGIVAIVAHRNITEARIAALEAEAERRRAEREHAARAREDALFRALTEQSMEFVAILQEDGAFRYVGPSVQRTLGYQPDDLLGRFPTELVHDEDRATMVATYKALRDGPPGHAAEMMVRLRHRDGSWRFFEGGGSNLIDHPAIRGITSVSRDVTARVEANRAAESRLRDQFAKIPVPTILWEVRGDAFILVDFNEAASGYFAARDAIGQPAATLLPQYLALFEEARGCLLDGTVLRRTVEFEPAGGTGLRTLDVTIGPQPPDRLLVHVTDVTEERRLTEALRQAQKMEAVGQLAGGIAHDFNNLLTVIKAHATFLLESTAPSSQTFMDAAAIQEAGDRAAELTRQLLAFSRQQIVTPSVVQLNHTVRDVYRLLARVISEDIRVNFDLGRDVEPVLIDPGQLEQVIVNLVVNARDAMPRGGTVSVATGNVVVTAGSEVPQFIQPGRYVRLSVIDTGVGMDADTQSKVFEPFFTTKAPGKGSGMGLSTVYGIVKQAGGYVTVASTLGEGARFDVYLPAAAGPIREETSPTSGLGSAADGRPSTPATILVAEDDEAVREIVRRTLEREGHAVVEAPDGPSAVALATDHDGPIDVVVSDAIMPGMSGLHVIEAIRARHPEVRALLVSGYTNDEMTRRGIEDADVEFLSKPFVPSELLRRIRTMLRR